MSNSTKIKPIGRLALILGNALYEAMKDLPEGLGDIQEKHVLDALEWAMVLRARDTETGECAHCGKHIARKDNPAWPYCTHNCGISAHYARKDDQHRAEFEAWSADPSPTKGPFVSTVIFD